MTRCTTVKISNLGQTRIESNKFTNFARTNSLRTMCPILEFYIVLR